MFWNRKNSGSAAIGVHSGPSGTAVAMIEGATSERPRVAQCDFLSADDMALSAFCKDRNLRQSSLVDVLSPENYNLIHVEVQNVKKDEQRETARWQVRELLDYPAEDAVIDITEVPVVGAENKTKTYAIAAPKNYLKDRVQLFKQLELNLKAIDIPEFVLRNLLELYQEETRGLCLLWIKPDSTLLIITRGETLYFSRLITVGMTQLLSEDSTGSDEEPISESLQMLLDTVVLEIQRSIDYCEGNFRLPPVPKILVAMCGEESQDILDYLDRYLQADVVSADFRQVLDLPLDIDPPTVNLCLPALGAALRAGGRG